MLKLYHKYRDEMNMPKRIKNKNNKSILIFFLISLSFFIFLNIPTVYAACPVCLLALPAAAGVAVWLGLDRLLIGLYLGALTVLLIRWLIFWLKKKNYYFKYAWVIFTILTYLAVIGSLAIGKLIPSSLNKLCGFDKLLLGIFLGSALLALIFVLLDFLNKQMKNNSLKPAQAFLIIVISMFGLAFLYPIIFKIICLLNFYS